MANLQASKRALLALGIAMICSGPPAYAQQGTPSTTVASIDPDAMAAMDKMSAALLALPGFTISADSTTDVVLENGQKIQYGGMVTIAAHRPDAFKISIRADTRSRDMYYDGKSFTIFAPVLKYYATVPAPATIGQTIDKVTTNFGIEIPLADLFSWGTNQTMRSRVKEAYVIRPETISGRTCMHYAFRQEQVDWQIWIDQGASALPCKIVVTDKTDPTQPQYTAVLSWDTSVPSKAAIAFAPPADAHKIEIADAKAMAAQGAGQ